MHDDVQGYETLITLGLFGDGTEAGAGGATGDVNQSKQWQKIREDDQNKSSLRVRHFKSWRTQIVEEGLDEMARIRTGGR